MALALALVSIAVFLLHSEIMCCKAACAWFWTVAITIKWYDVLKLVQLIGWKTFPIFFVVPVVIVNIPCGNFSRHYACMCDYYGLPYQEEVAWDEDTTYIFHNSKELNFRAFDYLDLKDLIPITNVLELKSFFLRFCCCHLKVSHECSERLLAVLKKSITLEENYVDNAGFKGDFTNKLSMAIISNSNRILHGIILSHNLIEYRGVTHLSLSLSKANRGLLKLSLSYCGQEEDCVIEALCLVFYKLKSKLYSLINLVGSNHSLQHLDLNDNYMCDPGAHLLSTDLQINTSIKALSIDLNSITVYGYIDFAFALKSKRTLICLSYPLHELMVATKPDTDKVDILWKQIQESQQRNTSLVGTSSNGHSTCVRTLHKDEATHKSLRNLLVNRLIIQVNEDIWSIRRQGSEERNSDFKNSRNILSDDYAAKKLLFKLVSGVEVAQDNILLNLSMKPMVEELQTFLTSHLQGIGDHFGHYALQHCNAVMRDSAASEQLRKSIENQSLFPVNVNQKAVMEKATQQLTVQFNEMSATLCRTVSDSVMDEVVQSLTNIYKTLSPTGDGSPLPDRMRMIGLKEVQNFLTSHLQGIGDNYWHYDLQQEYVFSRVPKLSQSEIEQERGNY